MSSNAIFKGDDSGAFGNNFITINLDNPLGYPISKAIFVCGCIQKPFKNPVFPLRINLTSQETVKLRSSNVCYLVVYDSEGRQKTCQGSLTFNAQNGVINNGGICC
jgi:hypothetical protein